ncbi:hypothetical protein VNO77_07217 [Canavalia gladiata]|uniref:Uncharacterized protein n=1 Tax=Canavalia gladiata TaxID=3824 RepID=A0AAN9QVP9_CANGL
MESRKQPRIIELKPFDTRATLSIARRIRLSKCALMSKGLSCSHTRVVLSDCDPKTLKEQVQRPCKIGSILMVAMITRNLVNHRIRRICCETWNQSLCYLSRSNSWNEDKEILKTPLHQFALGRALHASPISGAATSLLSLVDTTNIIQHQIGPFLKNGPHDAVAFGVNSDEVKSGHRLSHARLGHLESERAQTIAAHGSCKVSLVAIFIQIGHIADELEMIHHLSIEVARLETISLVDVLDQIFLQLSLSIEDCKGDNGLHMRTKRNLSFLRDKKDNILSHIECAPTYFCNVLLSIIMLW